MDNFIEAPESIKKILAQDTISRYCRKDDYIFKKNSKGFVEQEHRIVWKEHHGEIPLGGIIHHKDGNTKNNDINNLQLCTFQEHMNIHKKIKKE